MLPMRYTRWGIIFLLCLLFEQGLGQQIELLHADRLTRNKHTPKGASKLIGSVRLKHQDALMYCDSAILYSNNSLNAKGNVQIVESDSLTLKGDSLHYDGDSKLAKFRGNVTIDNRSSTLKTKFLDYNRETGVGTYYNGGEIDSRQEKIHLVSERGYYYAEADLFHFKKNVVMTHPDYVIKTDTMHYSTNLEKTWFFGPTDIQFQNRDIYCEYGWFDQLRDQANFIRNASIASGGQTLKGDTISYDQKAQIGISKCHVLLIDTNEKFEVSGDYAVYYEADSQSFVTDHMLMKQDMDGDTFWLCADTLFSLMDTTTRSRIVKTYHNTRFYKSDMQGQCDSLVYHTKDSVINMHRDPVLWSEGNQITADSIHLTMANGTLDKLYMNKNAFIISQESKQFYNQIKGINMIGYFVDATLSKVDVFGNGQTIYYPREEDGSLIGVNETKCSEMTIRIDSNTIEKISFYDKPTAKLTPADRMPHNGMRLDYFEWKAGVRPYSVSDLILGTSDPTSAPKKRPSAMARAATTTPDSTAADSTNREQVPPALPEAPADVPPAEQENWDRGKNVRGKMKKK